MSLLRDLIPSFKEVCKRWQQPTKQNHHYIMDSSRGGKEFCQHSSIKLSRDTGCTSHVGPILQKIQVPVTRISYYPWRLYEGKVRHLSTKSLEKFKIFNCYQKLS